MDVLAEAAQNGVDFVAVSAEQIVVIEMAIAFHVADNRLDRRSPAHLFFDLARYAALRTGAEILVEP